MTSYELWSLIVSALSAVGTIGAVAIALWATLHQRKRFKVKDIRVSGLVEKIGNVSEKPRFTEANAYFSIDNLQQFPLEVFSITISIVRAPIRSVGGPTSIGFVEELRGNFIPALSQYEIRIDILRRNVGFPKDEVGRISCEINTSAGTQVVAFPEKWKPLLLDVLSFKDNYSE